MSNSNKRPSITLETTNSKKYPRNSLTPLYGIPNLSKSFTKLRRKSDYSGQHGESLNASVNINGLSFNVLPTEGPSITKQKKNHKISESISKAIQSPARLDKEEDKNFLISILKKTSEDRTAEEITFLQEAFRDINILAQADKELDEKTFQKLLSKLKLETFKPGEQIFQYGETAAKFYIIIQGSVYILLKKRQIVGQPVYDATSLSSGNMSKKDLLLFSNRGTSEEIKLKKLESCYQGFIPTKTLCMGESFGEIALQISGDKTRTATVVCKEEVIFGVLSAEDYQESLGKIYEREYGKRLSLFTEMPLFKHWTRSQIAQLLLQTEEVAYPRNHRVFKEGDLPDKMYFIMQGEIELWRRVELEDKNSPSLRAAATTPTNISKARQIRKRKEMRLAILSVGQYFGASGILDNKSRDYSAISSSNEVRLISLTKEKFALFVKDPQTLEKLTSHIQQKEMWRESYANNYVNINSLYTTDHEAEKTTKNSKSATVIPNRSSIQWKDAYSIVANQSSDPKSNKLTKLFERMSSKKLTPTNHTSNKSYTIYKDQSFSRKIASPSPTPGNQASILNFKRSESKEREQFQILSFEQKSPSKKKSELEATYSRFQRRLDRILTTQQPNVKQREQTPQLEHQNSSELNNQLQLEKLKKAVLDDDCLEDFSLNFTRNGLPIHSQASLHLPNLPLELTEANDSLMVAGYGFKDSKEMREVESPEMNEGLKLNEHALQKYKLIKKLKIDRLYRDGHNKTPDRYLKIQLSMNNEIIDCGKRMRSPALSTTIQRLNRPQIGQTTTKFSRQGSETPESSLSYIIKNNRTINSQYETNIISMGNSPLTKKSSKMIYSKIQQVIDVNK